MIAFAVCSYLVVAMAFVEMDMRAGFSAPIAILRALLWGPFAVIGAALLVAVTIESAIRSGR